MPDFMDRLRPLVGSKGWDYCVLWRINEDQRFLKWIACCCAGAETGNFNKQDELMFSVISQFPCRDAAFHHQRTQCCDLLSQLPSSAPLESGIYAEAYFSSQPRWLNTFSDPHPNKPPTGELPVTRLLIPVLGGLVELLVAKQVPEDRNTVDFIVAQCAAPLELDAVLSSSLRVSKNHGGSSNYPFHQPEDSIDLQACELSCFWQKMSSRAAACNGFQEMEGMSDMPGQNMELFSTKDLNDKDAVRAGACRSGSISDCSVQIDDEDDDNKCLKRNGKGQAKNLEAERRRRKKLNERLYKLRALVPIISKLDKAAILVDAIEYVKQLRKQVEELQEELEQDSDNNGTDFVDEFGGQVDQNLHNPFVTGSGGADSGLEKVQQMEPKVEVKLVDASKFFIRVFCEQRPGGLVRMLEVFRSLGLEVVDVNVTSCRLLVSNVFQVEMKGGDTDQVVADDLRNSLVELTRIPFL